MAKILLVEDDQNLANLYKTAFEVEGHTVDISNDGEDGLSKATSKKYDIILLDIVLPNMSGLDILKKIKENEETKTTKVIMLTNYGQQENVKQSYDFGAEDVFLKYRMTPVEAARKITELTS